MSTLAQRIKRSPLSHDAQLVKMARKVGRIESRVRRLTRDLKDAKKDLRHARKELRGYAQSISDLRDPANPPMRMYGEQ